MIRIAYVINSLEGGGAALPVPAVARVLTKTHGARVAVFALTRRNGRAAQPMIDAGLEVRVREGSEAGHLGAGLWLDRELGAWKPDLIWTSLTRATLLGQLVGRRRGVPVVSWQHNAFLKPANRLLLRATQGLSAHWVGDSDSVTALTATRLGIGPDRLSAWPLFMADAEAPQVRAWCAGDVLKLGSLGRLHRAKGYDVLIGALVRMRAQGFRAVTPFEITIAGEGAEQPALEAALATAGIDNVRLSGFESRPKEFLAGLHLYLQPSRAEGLCIAAHEAMQAGLPAIVTSVGELPHSVRDGVTGLAVPPMNAEALAQALVWCLSHPERLADMGAAARARILARFSPQAFEDAGASVLSRLNLRATSAATPSLSRLGDVR